MLQIKEDISIQLEAKKEEPQPLRKPKSNPIEFPLDALPTALKDTIVALHDIIQAPIAICAQSIISTINLVVQGYADVRLPFGQVRPISCYFLTIAESGERKTSCDNEALKGIHKHEKNLYECYLQDYNNWQKNFAAWESQKNLIIKDKKSDYDKKKKALADLGEPPSCPLTPMLICPDPTFEGLCKLMEKGQPSLGIFASEGGQFIGGYGMKEDNKIKTAAALSDTWDGNPIKRVRSGDGVTILRGRRLCMHLMLQPNIANKFLCDADLKDQGLLSRFLIAAPASAAGTRLKDRINDKSHQILDNFHLKISSILANPLPTAENSKNELIPKVMELDAGAKTLLREFSEHIERHIGQNMPLENIKGLANKLPEHAARIAATIALFENIDASTINTEHIKTAISLVSFYAGENLRLAEEGIVDQNVILAEKLLHWLQTKWGEEFISLPDIYQRSLHAIKTKAKAAKIASILEDHGWLEKCTESKVVSGQLRKEVWKVVR